MNRLFVIAGAISLVFSVLFGVARLIDWSNDRVITESALEILVFPIVGAVVGVTLLISGFLPRRTASD